MYAKCGCLVKTQEIFETLTVQGTVSWNALIERYVNQGLSKEALYCFGRMQKACVPPDSDTFFCCLKACGGTEVINTGREIHAEIVKLGFDVGKYLTCALVDMYVKCASHLDAENVIDRQSFPDVPLWNMLIAGHGNHGSISEALHCFERMKCRGVSPNEITFIAVLKTCIKVSDVNKGREIHTEIYAHGFLDGEHIICNTLVDMYAKFGFLAEAQYVFKKLSTRSTVSWNTLIAGFTKQGHGKDALSYFHLMQKDGLCPSTVSYACALKACGMIESADEGKTLHADVSRKGLEDNVFISNSLLFMYAECGLLVELQVVFDKLNFQDVASWNALIGGYAKHGYDKTALYYFERMQFNGIVSDSVTFLSALKACIGIYAEKKGTEIHIEIIRKGLENNISVGSSLINMYVNSGLFVEAHQVFDNLPHRNVVSWNVIIAGYVEHELGEVALNCFGQMQKDGIRPNRATFIFGLKACSSIRSIDNGIEIHGEVARRGIERDLHIGSSLVDMYANCSMLAKAREVFDGLPVKNIVSWTALIGGYAEHGFGYEALACLETMRLHGLHPNNVTLVCIVKACGCIGAIGKLQELHSEIVKCGWLEVGDIVGNALVDVYSKCGFLQTAQQIFENLRTQDEISWNALILGHINNGYSEGVLVLFEKMQRQKIAPSPVTIHCYLKACGMLGTIDKAREMHRKISENRQLKHDYLINIALIDMYVKCSLLVKAQDVFENLSSRDVVSWNTLIAGYAQQGDYQKVFDLFQMMPKEETPPDMVTFLCLITACNHAGLAENGCMYFRSMYEYGITPGLEHHTAMVDLLGRAGQLGKIVDFSEKIPFLPNCVLWHILLSACRKWGYMELGRKTFEHVMELDEMDDAAYFYLSNIYSDFQMRNSAMEIQAMRVQKQVSRKGRRISDEVE